MLQLLSENIYFISVSLFIFCAYLIINFRIKASEKQKKLNIKKLKEQEAIETESPFDDQLQKLKYSGIEGIEQRFGFIKTALPVVLFLIWILMVGIPYLGHLPTVYISIVTAVFSVVVGIALRPFLENLFSGMVISFFKAIRVGDTVIVEDAYGTVEQLGLTYSTIKKWDWTRVVIPNSSLITKEVKNLTLKDPYVWAHIEFFVSPEADIEEVRKAALKAASESPNLYDIEAPSFWIIGMEKDTIKCWLAAWAKSPSEAWELRSDMSFNLMKSFQSLGIKSHTQYFQSSRHGHKLDNFPPVN